MKIVNRTVYVAADGKEFETAIGCKEYEEKLFISERREKIDRLLASINRMKRGKGIDSLSYRLDALRRAKEELLKSVKGKSRHTRKFAEDAKAASELYLLAHSSYNSLLREFYDRRKELKNIVKVSMKNYIASRLLELDAKESEEEK